MEIMQNLVTTAAERRKNRPAAAQAVMDEATEMLEASGIEDRTLKAGDSAPDFTLPDALGEPITLSAALAAGRVVLSFYRGAWCPYCNLELQAYQRNLDAIEDAGASLIAVSPMTPDNSLSLAEKHALRFTVLSDADNAVARQFGLVFRVDDALNELYQKMGIHLEMANDSPSHELPIPATYVIDRNGIILLGYANPDYTQRLAIEEVLKALST